MTVKIILFSAMTGAAVTATAKALTRATEAEQDHRKTQLEQENEALLILGTKTFDISNSPSLRNGKSKGDKKRAAAALRTKGWK